MAEGELTDLPRTPRGLRIYAKLRVKGREVIVQESSHPNERRCWLFVEGLDDDGLNEAQARAVRDALDAFLEKR